LTTFFIYSLDTFQFIFEVFFSPSLTVEFLFNFLPRLPFHASIQVRLSRLFRLKNRFVEGGTEKGFFFWEGGNL
jgi:hypothetical protein